ncbi:glycosyltransferase [Microbacterium sp. No. 7]|uniref:glycosyltransferase n=1 Tax=Microbacterium sp. No. 7 TaxID=1714373 RepID=UPI0006D06EA1|nr:glycosyltransferase [Microbacterium sp. No. 7]
MAGFLFLTWNGGGTTVPVRAIAGELRGRGHDVRVLGHAVQAAQFGDAGIPFSPYPRAGGFEVGSSPRRLLALMRDRDAARDVDDELDARPVNLVVGDALLVSTLSALRRRGQRYALLEPTVDTLLRVRMRQSGPMLRPVGLDVRSALDGADAVVVASVRELDPRAGADAQHVGPMVRAVAARAERPTVLLSLSTFGFPHLADTWRRLMGAVSGMPARVIATTGPALDPAELDAPPNVETHRWGDHSEIMPGVSAVVTHGGHGTTIAALAHGVPVLVLPLDATSDQPGIGRIVERAGVGIRLPRRAPAATTRAAIERLLHDDDLRRRASELGARIRAYGGAPAGADALLRAAHGT